MMDNLFRASHHIIFKIIMILIIISLILMGISNHLIYENHNYVAKINGQVITYKELDQAIQNIYSRRNVFMGNKNTQLLTNDNYLYKLKQQTLAELINKVILEQYIHKLGLVISDDQIKQTIFAIPVFHTHNQFDHSKFYSFVHKTGFTPQEYVALIKKQLLYQQFIQGIYNTDFILPNEKDNMLAMALQIRTVRLAKFNISTIASKINVDNNEIIDFYQHHKNEYLSQEMFKVNYIPLNINILKNNITVNNTEIKIWYDRHRDQFILPTKKHYRIIQLKTRYDAEYCLQELRKGINFIQLAKNKSIDILSAKHGGDVGWVTDDNNIYEFKKANLNKRGQLSSIIKSSIGFFIVRLDDIKPYHLQPLTSVVRKEIREKIKQEKSIHTYHILQHKINNSSNKKLSFIETMTGIRAKETKYFTRNHIPDELNYAVIKKTIFNKLVFDIKNHLNNNLNIINIDRDHAIIILLTDYKKQTQLSLKDVYVQIKQQIKKQKAIKQGYINANKALFAIKQIKNDSLAKISVDINFSKPHNFSSITQKTILVQSIFALPQPKNNKSTYGISHDIEGNPILISLDKVTPLILNNQQNHMFLEQLTQSMRDTTFSMLLTNLNRSTQIRINKII